MQSVDAQSVFSKAALITNSIVVDSAKHYVRISQYANNEVEDIWISSNPMIPFEDYIELIFENTEIELSTLLISIILFERFVACSERKWSKPALYHIILTSIYISIKLNEDSVFDFKSFSFLVQVPCNTLSRLESEFLRMIDWKVFVDVNAFNKFCALF